MPNGGGDNCGTCWHNDRHEGVKGFLKSSTLPCRCLLRKVEIMDTLFTYCANHPYHDPEKHPFPVGPIFAAGEPEGLHYPRKVFLSGPDTEDIRRKLLNVLESMPEAPRSEYPSGTRFEEQAILQLGEFKEKRALAGLRRIIRFQPLNRVRLAVAPGEVVFGAELIGDRQRTIGAALESLAQILGAEAMDEVKPFLRAGIEKPGQPVEIYEKLALLRGHAVRALTFCGVEGRKAIEAALEDPVEWVVVEARQALG